MKQRRIKVLTRGGDVATNYAVTKRIIQPDVHHRFLYQVRIDMNKFASKLILLTVADVTVAMLMQGVAPAKAAPVNVTWFVGIGTGSDPAELPAEQAVVKKFNDSHPDIQIVFNSVDNK